ncbi:MULTISPECIES: YihY/virulence factor BrkB family protein [unclassified Frigoribacterium]|uniref:YihY/virulence factor BrkB family protein n=1 Tax=unclassified Frigoribacterium TaxID=2627005 RepID=UPI0006F77A11|nr:MULTISPECIES: YihY/virulence factor BrkB family protein [unclassified Frigoribacterium]KQO45102.1 ribonuclease BN [Frigoribacterium sp. Leaf254]KQT40584.1 ribonuclease BN [Frigoribacterium sp. Leaf415]
MAQKSTEREQQSPDEDDSRKPQDLTDVSKPSWGYVLGKALREFTRDQCTDLAAALTYYAVLAIFPALLAIVSLLGVVGQADSTAKTLLDLVSQFGSEDVAALLREPIMQLTGSPAAGVALVVGVLGALWSASGYVGAFGRAMNRVYGIDEGRPIWKLRPTMLGVTAFTVVLIVIAALILVISGPVAETVGDLVGLGSTAVFVWDIAKLPILAIIAIVIVAVLYYWAPNVKQPKFKWMSLGSLVALVIWLVASVGFAFYIANFSNYNKTYGSLGAVIVFLLWLWITNNALLFGAEFDAELERGRELQAGLRAERDILLPPRDTAQSEKKAAALAKDELAGMRLRQAAAATIEKNGDEVPEPDGEGGSEASESDRKKDERAEDGHSKGDGSKGDRDD